MTLSKSGIPYLTHVWNPVVGCTRGCPWCWARKVAKRIGTSIGCEFCKKFNPHLHPERFDNVTNRQRPAVVGLGFMTDLWGVSSDVPIGPYALRNRGVWCPQHIFVTATQCPENIPHYLNPPENWYLLVTAMNQSEAEERLRHARRAWPSQRIVLNLEPLLAPIDLMQSFGEGIGCLMVEGVAGVILGGMSGPMASQFPLDADWVRTVRDQCAQAGAPFYFKQWSGPPGKWPQGDVEGAPVLNGRIHQELPQPWARVLSER